VVRPGRWWVLTVSAAMLTFGGGMTFYAFPVYLDALVSRAPERMFAVSNAVSVFYLAFALAGVPVAWLVQRAGTRTVIGAGSLVCAVGLASVSVVDDPTLLAVAFGLVGVGGCATSLLPITVVIVRLFVQDRARALALTMTGFSVGGVGVVPLLSWLVHTYGVRTCAPWLAAAYLVLVGLPGALYVSSEKAAAPDGPATSSGAQPGKKLIPPNASLAGVPYRDAVRSGVFLVLSGTCAVLMANQMGPQVHLVRMGAEKHIDNPVVLITILAGSSLAGRLVGGLVMARTEATMFFAGLGVVQAAALVLLAAPTGTAGAVLGAGFFGVCIGNLGVVTPLLLVERFGLLDYPRILGLHQLVINLGMACGPSVLGTLHGRLGGYALPLFAMASASLACAVVIAIRFRTPGTMRYAA
jgi:MFS family permease